MTSRYASDHANKEWNEWPLVLSPVAAGAAACAARCSVTDVCVAICCLMRQRAERSSSRLIGLLSESMCQKPPKSASSASTSSRAAPPADATKPHKPQNSFKSAISADADSAVLPWSRCLKTTQIRPVCFLQHDCHHAENRPVPQKTKIQMEPR